MIIIIIMKKTLKMTLMIMLLKMTSMTIGLRKTTVKMTPVVQEQPEPAPWLPPCPQDAAGLLVKLLKMSKT